MKHARVAYRGAVHKAVIAGNEHILRLVDGRPVRFIGPSDLAASLGHLGDPGHPDVVSTIEVAIARIVNRAKPQGS